MARRTLTRDDRRLWSRVERTLDKVTVKAAAPEPEALASQEPKSPPKFVKPPKPPPPPAPVEKPRPVPHAAPHELEPRRHRRLARERDPIDAKIDLHGHGRFQAQDALTSFLLGAHTRGYRAVLVVTGKGSRSGGVGVIRASVAEWVAQPPLRAIVAGVSPAHRRHGGEGAVYVTLRR
jgi:DNA-nicking Smr family endonuclease